MALVSQYRPVSSRCTNETHSSIICLIHVSTRAEQPCAVVCPASDAVPRARGLEMMVSNVPELYFWWARGEGKHTPDRQAQRRRPTLLGSPCEAARPHVRGAGPFWPHVNY